MREARASLEPKRGADRNHRGAAGVDGLDDLGVVDALEVDHGDAEIAVARWRWMTMSETPSWAISTACAWRS
jgi:hypothetical protein